MAANASRAPKDLRAIITGASGESGRHARRAAQNAGANSKIWNGRAAEQEGAKRAIIGIFHFAPREAAEQTFEPIMFAPAMAGCPRDR